MSDGPWLPIAACKSKEGFFPEASSSPVFVSLQTDVVHIFIPESITDKRGGIL